MLNTPEIDPKTCGTNSTIKSREEATSKKAGSAETYWERDTVIGGKPWSQRRVRDTLTHSGAHREDQSP